MNSAPITISFSIGESPEKQFIQAVTIVSGGSRQNTTTRFFATNGEFLPTFPINLSPENPKWDQKKELKSGLQILVINHMKLTPPTAQEEGSLFLDCGYSDYYGSDGPKFSGKIAVWPIKNPMPVPCI
ncbi:MAG: hypothetical protein DHS20C18_12950 [Saprospiraceae bacterium]|nr:MAG: hypothetical protein DHS20C18_12950 [Saprospiraceae bacterium]